MLQEKLAEKTKNEIVKQHLQTESKKANHRYTYTDNVTKIISPLLFTIWVVCYWQFLAQGEQDFCVDKIDR